MVAPLSPSRVCSKKRGFSRVPIADPVSFWMAWGARAEPQLRMMQVQRRIEVMTRFRCLALILVLPVVALLAAHSGLAVAASAKSPVAAVNTAAGTGLKGYDPVEYFTVGRPTPGLDQYVYQWKGVTYRFASAENLALFKSDPEKYLPQYGGYCAYAMSLNRIADIDPSEWTIVDGRLYLNNGFFAQSLWSLNKSGNIASGDRRVVVTGLGLVTPLGTGLEKNWEELMAGRSGIGGITCFDVSDFTTRIGGEVRDFNPLDWIERRDVKKMDLFIQYAIAAAEQAMQQSGLKIGDDNAERVGVLVGNGIGGLLTLEENHLLYLETGLKRITPFCIPKLLSNLAPAQIAIRYCA